MVYLIKRTEEKLMERNTKESKPERWPRTGRQGVGHGRRERDSRGRDKLLFLAGLTLLAAAAAGQLAARNIRWFGRWYAVHVYSVIVSVAGRLWGIVPVSAAEIGLYGLGIGAVWYVIRHRKDWKAVASRAVLVTGAAASFKSEAKRS